MTCARVEKCSPLGAPATPCQGSRQGTRTQLAPKPEHTAVPFPEPSFSRGRSVKKKKYPRQKGSTLGQTFSSHCEEGNSETLERIQKTSSLRHATKEKDKRWEMIKVSHQRSPRLQHTNSKKMTMRRNGIPECFNKMRKKRV